MSRVDEKGVILINISVYFSFTIHANSYDPLVEVKAQYRFFDIKYSQHKKG